MVDERSLTEPQRAWVEALRSGKYKQGQGVMRGTEDRFCCLGVACDLAVEAGVIPAPVFDDETQAYRYVTAAAALPDAVGEWLAVRDPSGSMGGVLGSLVGLNDTGKSFEEIADIIESKPAGLFVEPS